jgi:hypothetical protein
MSERVSPPVVPSIPALTSTLETQAQALGKLVDGFLEVEKILQDAVVLMEEQAQALGPVLHRVDEHLRAPAPVAPHAMRLWTWQHLVLVAGVLLVGAALHLAVLRWGNPARYDGLALAVDAVLTQQYQALPRPVQEQLTLVYQQQGIKGPGQRQDVPKAKGDKK